MSIESFFIYLILMVILFFSIIKAGKLIAGWTDAFTFRKQNNWRWRSRQLLSCRFDKRVKIS